MAHGQFFWNELMTPDIEAAKAFYTATIGWTYQSMPMDKGGTYWMAIADGKPVGGMLEPTPDVPACTPPHWLSYIEVNNLSARLDALKTQGGHIWREPFDVPNVGRIAIVGDNAGAVMGWIEPVPR